MTEIEASLTTERLSAAEHSPEFRPRGIPRLPARPFLEALGCAVETPPSPSVLSADVNVPQLRLTVEAAPGGILLINQYANPFLAVRVDRGGRVETTERGTILVRPAPGRSEVTVRRVGLFAALRARLFGYRP